MHLMSKLPSVVWSLQNRPLPHNSCIMHACSFICIQASSACMRLSSVKRASQLLYAYRRFHPLRSESISHYQLCKQLQMAMYEEHTGGRRKTICRTRGVCRMDSLANITADVALANNVIIEREAVGGNCIALHIAYPHCCVGNLVHWLASLRKQVHATHADNGKDSSWA